MREYIILILIGLVIWLTVDIEDNSISEGTVVDKFYEPEEITKKWVFNPMTEMFDQKQSVDDEDYVIIVYGETKDGKYIRERFEVTESKFNDMEKGDNVKVKGFDIYE